MLVTSPTAELATYVLESAPDDSPDDVRREATRALLNFVGCALGGAGDAAMEIAIATLGPHAGKPICGVIGRAERFDPLFASLLNGISSHIHDYDDTTPRNYIHPTSPVASALFAFAGVNPVRGRDFVHAFILGFETVSRIGNATYPAHYEAGWHSTGSVGVFGAATAVGRLLGLTHEQMIWAIGLAATQSSGLREMFGSMGKALHPGRAAQSGYMAALLAQGGFTAGRRSLEGPRGFAAVQASAYDLNVITQGLGRDFELRANTYKPFPCGIVTHPTIDACIQLKCEHGIEASQIAGVQLHVAPLVKDLCDKKAITRGLEGKFSVYHAAAIGLVRGRAGLGEFTDAAVNDAEIARVRELVEATGDAGVGEDAVRVAVRLANGMILQKNLECSLGNLKRPLSDRQLEDKFRDQAGWLPPRQVEDLIAMCWTIENLEDVGKLVARAAVKAPTKSRMERTSP